MPNVTGGNSITSSTQLNTGVVTSTAILDDTITASDIAPSGVATSEILDGTIVDADISASAAITRTKLAAGTQGSIMFSGAAGAVSELAPGTVDYYLATQGAGANPIWKILAAPKSVTISTAFETAARFTTALTGSGAGSFNASGRSLSTGGGVAGSSNLTMDVDPNVYLGSPQFGARITYSDPGGGSGYTTFVGIGNLTVATAGITFTERHIGFKTVGLSLFATQADGTTENVSSALTTLTSGDTLELFFKINSTTSVDYYWSKNGGALSAATNLTTNLPTTTTTTLQVATSSNNSANGLSLTARGMYIKR